MKKIIALLLVLLISVVLAACTTTAEDEDDVQVIRPSSLVEPSSKEPSSAPEVYIENGYENDMGWSENYDDVTTDLFYGDEF